MARRKQIAEELRAARTQKARDFIRTQLRQRGIRVGAAKIVDLVETVLTMVGSNLLELGAAVRNWEQPTQTLTGTTGDQENE